MSLEELRQRAQSEPEVSPSFPSGSPTTEGEESGATPDSSPRGVSQVTVPAGFDIYYQAAPRRLYTIDSEEVPSITTLLEIVGAFGAGAWWGQGIGIHGAMEFCRSTQALETSDEVVLDWIKAHKLTVHDTRDRAADRGTSVHDSFETWATQNVLPNPDVHHPSEAGYVKGLLDFITHSGIDPRASEVMVGHPERKFAGRFDLIGLMPKAAEVCVKSYPKRSDRFEKVAGGFYLIDLKTSKKVQDKFFWQLAAYHDGYERCGYGQDVPIDQRAVLHVFEDGRYELVVRDEDMWERDLTTFLKVADAWRAVNEK